MRTGLKLLRASLKTKPGLALMALRAYGRNVTNIVDYHLPSAWSFRPKSITFRITGSCNLRCKMCLYLHRSLLDPNTHLPLEIVDGVLDDLNRARPLVELTGGEPLMHPQAFDVVRSVKSRGLHCSMVTNGLLLSERAGEVSASGLDVLVVSLDAPHAIHDRLRGVEGLFDKAVGGIKSVLDSPKRPMVLINASIQRDTYRSLEELVEFANDIGVDGVNLQALWRRTRRVCDLQNEHYPELAVGDGWEDTDLVDVDFDRLAGTLAAIRRRNGVPVTIFPSFRPDEWRTWYSEPAKLTRRNRVKCPWLNPHIFHDGTVRLCDELVMGDLREQSFSDIWNGDRMRHFRRTLVENRGLPICAGCCSAYREFTL